MDKYYYSIENDNVIPAEEITESYTEFASEYQTFSDYFSACMYWNNGDLMPIGSHISELNSQIRRMWNTWGNLCQDDITVLEAEIAYYKTFQ